MAKTKLPKRTGFFCELPASAIATIKRIAKRDGVAQWDVIDNAISRLAKLRSAK
jgi:hypothetical protein